MNFKRFISGVSAFAVSASAFVGMAITADAAVTEVDFIGSSTNAETFDSYSSTQWSPSIGTTEGHKAFNIADVNENKVLSVQSGNRAAYSATYTADKAVDNGTVNFNAVLTFATSYAHDGSDIILNDSDGNAVATIKLKAGSGNVYNTVVGATTANGTSGTNFNTRNNHTITIDATVDLDANTASVKLTNESEVTETLDVNIDAVADIKGLTVTTWNSRSNDSQTSNTYLDNVKFYANTLADKATALTVSYQIADGNEVATQLVDISDQNLTAGDTAEAIPYYVGAYVNGTDGKIYKTGLDTYNRTYSGEVSGGTSTKVVETVTLSDATQYLEYDGTPFDGASNGQYAGGIASSQSPKSFTVAVDGLYDIAVSAGATNYNRPVQIKEANASDGTVLFNTGATTNNQLNIYTGTGLALKAGITYYVVGGASQAYVDYVLLTKKGDLATVSPVTKTGDYSEYEDDKVKAFKFTVTPNDQTVTAVTVATDGDKNVTKDSLNLTGGGSVIFGVLASAASLEAIPDTFTATITVE